MVQERAGDDIPSREVDDWLNIVVSEVSYYLPVKANMFKSEINNLLLVEAAFTPTFDPFLPLAQTSDTMIGEDGAYFPADPFIRVISHYFSLSKTSNLKLTPKIVSMKVGNHERRQRDLERLNTAAVAGLPENPLSIAPPIQKAIEPAKATTSRPVHVKVAPVKPTAGVGAPAAATVVQCAAPKVKQGGKEVERVRAKVKSAEFVESDEEAPATKAAKGKGVVRAKVKSAEFVESDEAPATKAKGKGVGFVESGEGALAVKKQVLNTVPMEETDEEYEDEEDVPKKGKRKSAVPELYDLTAAKEGQVQNHLLRMPTNPKEPIVWDLVTLQQAIQDEEFEPLEKADHYVKEAQKWVEEEKEKGITRKKGGKAGKRGPFYWGPYKELDYEGAVSFQDAYDREKNLIDDNGIRRYLVADVFTAPCVKCASMAKPCFFGGGEPAPLGMRGVDELELNKACAPCREARHKCPGHSRLRQRTIIDNPFFQDGAYYKPAPKAKAKAPKAKAAAPKVTAPKVAAPKITAPAAAKVAGPSKPIVPMVKGNVPIFMPDAPSQMSVIDSTPVESMPKPKPRPLEKSIVSPSKSVPTENGNFLPLNSTYLTDQLPSSSGGPHPPTRNTVSDTFGGGAGYKEQARQCHRAPEAGCARTPPQAREGRAISYIHQGLDDTKGAFCA